MGVFSNDLAPNLFKSYTDWFDNWVKETGHKPEKYIDDMACRYFDALEYDVEMACGRCGHHLGYIKSSSKKDEIDRPIDGVKGDKKTCTFLFLCDLCRETIAENAMFKKTDEPGDNKDD